LPWYWAPPPPAIRNWWFWVWWKPLPINVSYYPSERVYYYGYEPYSSYYEPESAEYPVYSEEYGKHPGISQISSPEDYERWLAETLNLTKEQQLAFFPKLRSLAQLREQYITTRASLSYEIAKLQQSHIASAQLDEKNKELEKVDTQFKKKERKLMNELMKILTAEQKTKFLAEMKHYTTESAVGEKKEKK
jgi:Spy/CpxP family protein refolding chaperone